MSDRTIFKIDEFNWGIDRFKTSDAMAELMANWGTTTFLRDVSRLQGVTLQVETVKIARALRLVDIEVKVGHKQKYTDTPDTLRAWCQTRLWLHDPNRRVEYYQVALPERVAVSDCLPEQSENFLAVIAFISVHKGIKIAYGDSVSVTIPIEDPAEVKAKLEGTLTEVVQALHLELPATPSM